MKKFFLYVMIIFFNTFFAFNEEESSSCETKTIVEETKLELKSTEEENN